MDVTSIRSSASPSSTRPANYRMAEDPKHRDLAVAEEGYSRYFKVPQTADDLLQRSALIEAGDARGQDAVWC